MPKQQTAKHTQTHTHTRTRTRSHAPARVKDAGARGAPAACREVRLGVRRRENRRLVLFIPQAHGPVADRHVACRVEWVALNAVDRAVVLAAVLRLDDARVRAALAAALAHVEHEHRALLRADEVLSGPRLNVVLHARAAQYAPAAVRQLQHLRRLSQLARVPPHHLPVRRHRRELRVGL